MVFYRKYRPQTIDELDSQEVREKLISVVVSESTPHAFLFTGPKGLGKTSAARIVAKAVNCERLVKRIASSSKDKKLNVIRYTVDTNPEPCNQCHQCVSIINGTNIDVLEIDGASNRGIDEIRDLREKVRLAPASSIKKVYIIDEVHMLTTEAFNALLKTLEEPPNHVIFILCTTDPQKVPPTIVSRCFHIPFKRASTTELARSLQRIIDKEKLDVDNNALNLLAHLSDGSFRDGAKILEEIRLVAKDKKITKELVEQKYQISNIQTYVEKMLHFLGKRDTKRAILLVSELIEHGVDIKYFVEQMINALHGFLLHKIGVKTSEEFSKVNYEFSIEDIKNLVELLTKADADLKYAVLPQLPLEMAIVGWGIQKTQNTQIIRESDSPKVRFSDSPSVPRASGASRASQTDNFWQELINKVKSHNHSIAAVLRGCELKEYDRKNLVIETKYKFHKERLEDKKVVELLEKVCKEISGKEPSISVLLKE